MAVGSEVRRSESTLFAKTAQMAFLSSEISGVDDFFELRAGREKGARKSVCLALHTISSGQTDEQTNKQWNTFE